MSPKITTYYYDCSSCGSNVSTQDGIFACSACRKVLCANCSVGGVLCKEHYESLPADAKETFDKKIRIREFADGMVIKMLLLGIIFIIPGIIIFAGAEGNAGLFALAYLVPLFVIAILLKLLTPGYESTARKVYGKATGNKPKKIKIKGGQVI